MEWLLLIYRIPRQPSAGRVFVWRKLNQLGAIALQDAVWVLPSTPRTREQFQWLAAEISELGGEPLLFASQVVYHSLGAGLQEQFETPVRAAYGQILTALRRPQCDLPALAKRYQQIKSQDYFRLPLGEQVRRKLLSAKGGNR